MKSFNFLTIALSMVALGTIAKGNLGDTRAQSIEHFGPEIRVKPNGVVIYETENWEVTALFNEDRLCEMIAYYKKVGKTTQEEMDNFCKVNFPASLKKSDWRAQKTDDNSYQLWFSRDNMWRLESCQVADDTTDFSSIVIGTVRAAAVLWRWDHDHKNDDPTVNPQSSSTHPKGWLPL